MNDPVLPVGGFFGLERPRNVFDSPILSGRAFRSGRSCLRAILEQLRPKRLLAPFYVCDAALAPAEALGIPLELYELDRELRPRLPPIQESDAVLVVDYFGLLGRAVAALQVPASRLIVDQTQALFGDAPAQAWRFNSFRKWFGVPDGGCARGPVDLLNLEPARLAGIPEYLIEKTYGDPRSAYQAFSASEAALDCELKPISAVSLTLVGLMDVTHIRRQRRENYAHLAERLQSSNLLDLPMQSEHVPFCYPFLPRELISTEELARASIFVPRFWRDCEERLAVGFEWELELCKRLLPLPIDHRYGPDDMDRVATQVIRTLNAQDR